MDEHVSNASGQIEAMVAGEVELKPGIAALQAYVWEHISGQRTGRSEEILCDLAYDLDYYAADPDARAQSPSYIDALSALRSI